MGKKFLLLVCSVFLSVSYINADKIINVPCKGDDQIKQLQKALTEASKYKGENITIKLQPTVYKLHRDKASKQVYHVSNTTSVQENPDPTKHIGIWLKDLNNLTIDGNGATILTHGEMTPMVIDNCNNIRISNLKIDAADPSVVEIDITKVGDHYIEFEVLPPTQFEVKENFFYFKGYGWIFGDEKRISNHTAIAQIYDPVNDVTLRTDSPIQGYTSAKKIGPQSVKLTFDYQPKVKVGERYQLRHSIRNEVCMFINLSKNIEIKDVDYHFMGNFGVVSQFTENITMDNIHCEPSEESGRTNAGFADFLQFSSCKGLITITNSKFSGSHDDPINIHGTHLQVVNIDSPNKITVAYRHPQTFGFSPCQVGDEIAFVNRETLNYVGKRTKVLSIKSIDDYQYEIELSDNLKSIVEGEINSKYVIENLTWIPEVKISGNYFSRTPTRAILISTAGKSLIEKNTFYHIPMASILVADDANSWYESGPVNDLTIRDNTFEDCKSPVILIAPEIKRYNAPVHSNINIIDNKFLSVGSGTIKILATDGISINNNLFTISPSMDISESNLFILNQVNNCKIGFNSIKQIED